MAIRRFQPVVKRARVGTPGFSADSMLKIANQLNNSIAARLDQGLDVYDAAAPPLSDRYREYKQKKIGSSIRDLRMTGRTRRGMRALSAEQNKAVIGFSDPVAADRVRFNQRRSRQYGVSPKNERDLVAAVREIGDRPVVISEVA